MKILLIGANGKMGRQMQTLLKETEHEYLGIDVYNRALIENYPADVMLDFSSPNCLIENLNCAIKKNIPIVIATTNHSNENLAAINEAKEKIAVLLTENFSLLFNILIKIIPIFKSVSNCEFLVQETHHKTKKDSPSGSCKQILKELKKLNISPQIACFRMGNIVGEHQIKIVNSDEILEIKHSALNKKVFCEGALKACNFIINKTVGLYTSNDLYNLKN